MKREFNYEIISLENIDNNKHLVFICDGDSKTVKIEREEEYE